MASTTNRGQDRENELQEIAYNIFSEVDKYSLTCDEVSYIMKYMARNILQYQLGKQDRPIVIFKTIIPPTFDLSQQGSPSL